MKKHTLRKIGILVFLLFALVEARSQTIILNRSFNPFADSCSDSASYVIVQTNPSFGSGKWYRCFGSFYLPVDLNAFISNSSPPIDAPGLVTLTDAGTGGSLTAGTYKFTVAAVDSFGYEGQFDLLGYSANNTITVGANHKITVSWLSVPRASLYHVYVWGTTGVYYQRYYSTTDTTFTLLSDPVGPVAVPLTVTPSNSGGNLRYGNYYFDVEAEFSDGGTVDQTNYNNFPVASITSDAGSVTLSWTALTGATVYRVYVVSESDGSPRTHTKYFTTTSNNPIVTGTETYITTSEALQMHGDSEAPSSSVGIFGSIRTIANAKSFFQGDIQIAGVKNADAMFQANRFDANGGAGLSLRQSATPVWELSMLGGTQNFSISRNGVGNRYSIDATTGLHTFTGSLQPSGNLQFSTTGTVNWLSSDVNTVRIYTFGTSYGIGTNSTDLNFFASGGGGFTFSHGGISDTAQVKIDSSGKVGIGTSAPTSSLQVVGLPVFANNAAAITGGLTVGAFYRTGADPDFVAVVH